MTSKGSAPYALGRTLCVVPAQVFDARLSRYGSRPALTSRRNDPHASAENRRIGPSGSLLSRPVVPPGRVATSTQLHCPRVMLGMYQLKRLSMPEPLAQVY